jgi:hypothetical protein
MENENSLAQTLAELANANESGKSETGDLNSAAERELAPLRAEMEKLKSLKREIIFERLRLTRPDFDFESAKEGLKELEESFADKCLSSGLSGQVAREVAKQASAAWENEEGLMALSIMKKLKNGEQLKVLSSPDFHLSAAAGAPQIKGWREKMKSGEIKERLSVFDDMFS